MPSRLHWNEFRLLTFDCYGTLIDWEAGILSVLRPWAGANKVQASDDELLRAFGAAESAAEKETPRALYRDILSEAMSRIAASFGTSANADAREKLAQSVGDWPAFADTAESLRILKKWHMLMVVSNVDKASFARTAPKLGAALDGLTTAEDVGAYKPDRRMFERAISVAAERGIAKTEILHVAQSLYHDIAPAGAMGLRTVWVDRRAGRAGGATPQVTGSIRADLTVGSLAELVEIERAERA